MLLDFLLNLMNKLNKTDSAAFKFCRSSLFLKYQFFPDSCFISICLIFPFRHLKTCSQIKTAKNTAFSMALDIPYHKIIHIICI